MGYIEGNLVQTTGGDPVFKVNVSSDNSPHCWNALPNATVKTLTYKGKPVPWLTIGAVSDADLSVQDQISTGFYWKIGSEIASYKTIPQTAIHTGLAFLAEKFGLKLGVRLTTDGMPVLDIMVAKRHTAESKPEGEEEDEEDEEGGG